MSGMKGMKRGKIRLVRERKGREREELNRKRGGIERTEDIRKVN